VNAQRPTDGIAVPAELQGIVHGENLDSFPLPASFDRYTQPQGKAANVDSAIPSLRPFPGRASCVFPLFVNCKAERMGAVPPGIESDELPRGR
jgi:hypothetical protein